MATLTIKNIPEELYAKLKQSAQRHHRSVNSHTIVCLEQALRGRRLDPEAFLARVRILQQKVSLPELTDEFLQDAKNEGRP